MTEAALAAAFWVTVWVTVGTAAYLVYGNRPTTLPVALRLRAFYRVQESARAASRLVGTMLLWPVFVSLVLERDPWLALPFILLAPFFLIVGSVCSERVNKCALGSVMVLLVVLMIATPAVYHEAD